MLSLNLVTKISAHYQNRTLWEPIEFVGQLGEILKINFNRIPLLISIYSDEWFRFKVQIQINFAGVSWVLSKFYPVIDKLHPCTKMRFCVCEWFWLAGSLCCIFLDCNGQLARWLLNHPTGTSNDSHQCDSINKFWFWYYNGGLWEILFFYYFQVFERN